jgi:hypothetical protein
MKKRTKLAAGAGAALAVAGAGGAIAATKLSPADESNAVVEDAAKQLGVSPQKLDAALRQAFENRIDEGVEAGRIPKELGEAMKRRLESGELPLFAGPMLGPRHHHARVGLSAAATYLGISEAELREALENGKTLAEVAKAEGKSVDGLVDALVTEQTKRLDDAVADGRLTKAERDEMVAGLKERTRELVERGRPGFLRRHNFGFDRRGFGFPGDREREALPPRPA